MLSWTHIRTWLFLHKWKKQLWTAKKKRPALLATMWRCNFSKLFRELIVGLSGFFFFFNKTASECFFYQMPYKNMCKPIELYIFKQNHEFIFLFYSKSINKNLLLFLTLVFLLFIKTLSLPALPTLKKE